MQVRLKSKVLTLYFDGKSPEQIAEQLDYPLSHITKAINEIKVDVRKQKELESESRLIQIKCIEDALFKAIKDKNDTLVNSLKFSYSTFCL